MSNKKLFWLHIKKSAGVTTRNLLGPYYTEVDRSKKPKTFIQADPAEYNDMLNNYRLPLGEYQFKRCQFAQKYLYQDTWNDMFTFAFSREPTDRCISMFYYLWWKDAGLIKNQMHGIKMSLRTKKFLYSTPYAFDVFLEYVQSARTSDSIYQPMGLHFTTHTAPMWEDITDAKGNILLTKVFRLENVSADINYVFNECGINNRIENKQMILNKNKRRGGYAPSREQLKKIEKIYRHDFEIYENAGRKSRFRG